MGAGFDLDMSGKADNSGYDLIAEIVNLTGLPERESTRLLINIIKKAKLEPKDLKIEDLRSALGDYLSSLSLDKLADFQEP